MVARRAHDRRRTASARRVPEIVLVDVGNARRSRHRRRSATRGSSRRPGAPTARAIVAAAAPDDETFNLFEFAVDGSGARQLTHTTGGATWPDVSPDGKTIVFVGYTHRRRRSLRHAVSVRLAGSGAALPGSACSSVAAAATESKALAAPDDAAAGRPPRLQPARYLEPDVVDAGRRERRRSGAGRRRRRRLSTSSAITRTPRPRPGSCRPQLARRRPSPATPDWQIYYLYDRWRPTFYVSASSDTSFFAGPATDAGTPTPATRRERQLEGRRDCSRSAIRACSMRPGCRSLRADADYTLADGAFSRDRTRDSRRLADQSRHARTATRSATRMESPSASRRKWCAAPSDRSPTRRPRPPMAAPICRGLAPHHVFARARRRRRLPRRRHGRPHVPARRPLARNRRRRFRQRRLLAAARLQRRQLRRQPRRRGERRIPLADRATAAWSSARGRCSCIPCTPAIFADAGNAWTRRLRPACDQVVGGRATLRGSRRRILRAVHA